MKFANIMSMKDFLIYITFIAVLGFSATAPATQSFDLSVFDKKQVKIEEFTDKIASFYFDGINDLEKPGLTDPSHRPVVLWRLYS